MPPPLLRDNDQRVIAALTVAALASMFGWWLLRGGPTGRLINIERADPLGYEFLVDVNRAEWPELAQLPEVGEILARRIVEDRRRRGPFGGPEDLLRVNGIGEKKLDRFRRYLLPMTADPLTAGP